MAISYDWKNMGSLEFGGVGSGFGRGNQKEKLSMIINETYRMLSFPEFLAEVQELVFKNEEFQSRNYTTQNPGWTEALYEAQDGHIFVEYLQTRIWRYLYNGVSGEALTLSEAKADHKSKYSEHLI